MRIAHIVYIRQLENERQWKCSERTTVRKSTDFSGEYRIQCDALFAFFQITFKMKWIQKNKIVLVLFFARAGDVAAF